MIPENKRLAHSFLLLFAMLSSILGPFSTTFVNSYVVVSIFLLSMFTFLVMAAAGEKITLSPVLAPSTVFYFLLMVVALFSIIYSRDFLTGEYLKDVIFGRIFTLVTSISSLFILCWWLSKASFYEIKFVLSVCLFILFIFMLLGFYQFLCNFFGIKFFIETRDWMHGVPTVFKNVVPKRITSISEEPNFLSPLITEFLLLSLLLLERKILKIVFISLGVFILIFSFSGGAYINALLVAVFASSLSFLVRLVKGKISIYDIFLVVFFSIAISLFCYFGDIIFEFVSYKFQNESSGGSSRSMFISSLLKIFSESDVFQMIFGHGLATMSVLDSFGLPKEEYLFRISNNFFLDMLWESGVVGVFLIFVFYSLNIITGIRNFTRNKYFFYGTMLSIHILIVSFYRSEYLSSHFIFVMAIIGMLYHCGYAEEKRL